MKNWIKHSVAVALGAAFLASSVQAQPRGDDRRGHGHDKRPAAHDMRPSTAPSHTAPRPAPHRPQVQAPQGPRGSQARNDHVHHERRDFRRGERLPNAYRSNHYVVDNWRTHGLKSPPRGQHWVQVGGDYLLVSIATGVIASVLLGH